MSSIRFRSSPLPVRPGLPARELLWGGAAVLVGAGVGIAAGAQQTFIAVGIALLPVVVVLAVQPRWLPALLVASAFGEAISTGSVTLSRLVAPLALLVI